MEQLVYRAMAGNADSFIALIQAHQTMLYRVAYVYVRGEEDALEVVQQTVCKAFEGLGKLKQPRCFKTWITKILIHCAVDVLRQRQKTAYLDDEVINTQTSGPPEEALDLQAALDRLVPRERLVITLRYFQDFKLKEIASVTGMPEGTVKSCLYRGLAKLKISMEGEEVDAGYTGRT